MFPSLPTKDKQICGSQGRSPFRGVCEEVYRGLLFGRDPSSSQDIPQNVPHPVMPIFETRELLAMNCMLPVLIHASFTADGACFVFRVHRDHQSVLEYRSEERRVGKECRSRWSP